MKKYILAAILAAMFAGTITGCSQTGQTESLAGTEIQEEETNGTDEKSDSNDGEQKAANVPQPVMMDENGICPVGMLMDNGKFIGNAWCAFMPIVEAYNCPPVALVTFEPGCRNDWHSHKGGQLLIVTAGKGYYQEEGKPARLLHEGDVVEIGSDVKHWHGATADSWFAHIAIETNADMGGTAWYDPVDGESYRNLKVENPDDTEVHPLGNAMDAARMTGQGREKSIKVAEFFKLPPASYETFETSARTNWHTTDGGVILTATAGEGYSQIVGEEAKILHTGEMTYIPAGSDYWYGAGKNEGFTVFAITVPAQEGQSPETMWSDALTEEQYDAAVSISAGQTSDRITAADKKYQELFGDAKVSDIIADSELYEIVNHTVYGEIYQDDRLTDKEREMAALATLTANNTLTMLETHVYGALNAGMTPVEITETIYQCAPYAGSAKALEAIDVVNRVFEEKGLSAVGSQATITEENRWQEGINARTSIYGDMGSADEPEGTKTGGDYLPSFCFGDFYTRTGLTTAQREMVTFCCLAAMGDVDGQLGGHVQGNANVGNDREYLLAVATACMPYTGFPRMLNTISVINQILPPAGN